jgi:peptidoglycan-N-acetylglucosamine deacetylase
LLFITREKGEAMSVYLGKILELIAIERDNGKPYLHIKFTFDQEIERFWEIDNNTAENLMIISEFAGSHQYRLSLHTTWDTIQKQYISVITKTYRDKSERIYFACSEDYKNNLDSIKNTESINDLNEFPFLSMNLSIMDEKKIEQKNEQNEVMVPKEYKFPFKWVSVAIVSFVLIILFGYSNNSYLKKTPIKNTTIPKAEAKTVEVSLENKITPDTKIGKDDSIQSSIPYLELTDSITYSIPEGYVSLTFDDGPSKYTAKIIDILKGYNVGGTFFFIGMNVKKHPDYVQYVQANGYSIGSHSMNHVKMSGLSFEKQKDELIQSTKAIEDITGEKVVLLRPPYGAFNEQTKGIVHDDMDKMILWNKDPNDWKTHDADNIFNYIRNTDASGSIILLHESQAVVDALPKIITHLQKQNLEIVSLQ